MNLEQVIGLIESVSTTDRSFAAYNFGCRVNSAELNQLSQILINLGFSPLHVKGGVRGGLEKSGISPDIILINTCSITQKGEFESLQKVRHQHKQYPRAIILVTGCAHEDRIKDLPNVYFFDNKIKEEFIAKFDADYSPKVGDKFSSSQKYLLRVQSGCTQFCSFCTVPYRRQYLWSMPIDKAVNTVKKAVASGYQELIITGVNLDQYHYGFSNLVEAVLKDTEIALISFGSIPLNCIDDKFIDLLKSNSSRISHFLHIPLQSGSNKVLKLMNRPYNRQKILETFSKLKRIKLPLLVKGGDLRGGLELGTDIIVGFPGETDEDFQATYELCQKIGFSKIHTFRYSPRLQTLADHYYKKFPKIQQKVVNDRARLVRQLSSP